MASPRKSLSMKKPEEEGFVDVESDDYLTHWGFDGGSILKEKPDFKSFVDCISKNLNLLKLEIQDVDLNSVVLTNRVGRVDPEVGPQSIQS